MTDGIDSDSDQAPAEVTPEIDAEAGEALETEFDPAEALAKATAEAEENWAKYLRATAELENLRKRGARDVENARKYGVEQFATELLTVVDSLEMGLESAENATAESLLEGKQATLKLLRTALEKSGIESVDPEGEPFDPQLHEAMTMQPSESAEPGSVLAVIQKGYQLNGRLLRPARVIVAGEAG
jgi:molecular chaperone GrpE